MHRSALFNGAGLLAGPLFFAVMLPPAAAQGNISCGNGKCVRVFEGSAPAASKLRVNAHGPVAVQGAVADKIAYTIKVTVSAHSEAMGRRLLENYRVRVEPRDGWLVLTTPGGSAMSTVTVRAPRLDSAVIATSEGAVQATGIEGSVDVDSGAGELFADRIGGDCKLLTGAGDVNVGQVSGGLHCTTGAGRISVRSVRGEAILQTQGGDIMANEAGASLRAETGGGGIHIGSTGGAVTAISGGGQIVVEKAGGVVTLRNLAGPVQVGSAAGVRCESLSGGVRIARITGPMRVSTSMGSIFASLMGGRIADSFLATANGDITVLIPSNLGVTIQAQNSMADTLRRIVSDFPAVPVRRQGTRIIAEGAVNGGGPLLQISGTGGTIYIKRQP